MEGAVAVVETDGVRTGREDGNDGAAAGAAKKKDSVTCWRCRATGHYSDSCTTKLHEGCGGK